MSASDATVWIFLAIFVLSAAIALASLPEWISIGDYYKKKLFLLLLLEVIGCIVGFGAGSVRSILTSVPLSDIRSTMISNESGWEFQDAQEERIFRFRFEPGPDNSVTFLGETYHLADYARKHQFLLKELSGLYDIRGSGGAFYLFIKAPWGTGSEFVAKAIENELLLIPGNVFSQHDTHFRLSFAAEQQTLERGVEVLKKLARG